MLQAMKLGSTSRFGSRIAHEQFRRAVRAHAGQVRARRPCLSPSNLWQIAQFCVNSSLPFATSPGFSTSGVNFASSAFFSFSLRATQFVENLVGPLATPRVAVRAQAMNVGRTERGET